MYQLKITTAGKNAVFAANTAGLTITINQVAIGTGRRIATADATSLLAEVARVSILRSLQINASTRQIDYEFAGTSNNPGIICNPIGEIGLYLSTGVLFAYWSDTLSIPAAKSASTTLRGSLFLVLDDLPASAIIIQATKLEPLVLSFAGNGGEGDIDLAAGTTTTMKGKRRFRNFRLRSGATLIVDKYLELLCSGEAIFEPGCAVSIPPPIPGGAPSVYTSSSASSPIGWVAGQNFGSTGGTGQSGKNYPLEISPVGSGGQTGHILKIDNTVYTSMSTGRGGSGGGYLGVKAQLGIAMGGTFTGQGGNADPPTISPNGAGSGSVTAGGSGGGSGSAISMQTPGYATINPALIINLSGGDGSTPLRTPSAATGLLGSAPGSGGGGGIFEFISPNLPTTFPGTINVQGGMSGAYTAGNINTASSTYLIGGSGGAFGSDAPNSTQGDLAPTRQASGRILLLPIMPG